MKLGEIKVQALMLMYPSLGVKVDSSSDESINNLIFELKANPNYEALLLDSVGAINRALSYLEFKGISKAKCVQLQAKEQKRLSNGKCLVELKDLYRVESVKTYINGSEYELSWEQREKEIILDYINSEYYITYKAIIPRISQLTEDSLEIDLPREALELIPYYVKWELFVIEDYSSAKESREYFENMVSQLAKDKAQCKVLFSTIYTQV